MFIQGLFVASAATAWTADMSLPFSRIFRFLCGLNHFLLHALLGSQSRASRVSTHEGPFGAEFPVSVVGLFSSHHRLQKLWR